MLKVDVEKINSTFGITLHALLVLIGCHELNVE
jgi:hypothetical protein